MELDSMLKPEVILASNTSSISITRLGAQTQRPGQVIGMHFFNPVPVMKLVEVIRGLETTDETFAQVKASLRRPVLARIDESAATDAAGWVKTFHAPAAQRLLREAVARLTKKP